MMAYKDNPDILTLSIGEPSGWNESITNVVASRIALSGKVVTVAAGNDVRFIPFPLDKKCSGAD